MQLMNAKTSGQYIVTIVPIDLLLNTKIRWSLWKILQTSETLGAH